jgi:hypothetical protein
MTIDQEPRRRNIIDTNRRMGSMIEVGGPSTPPPCGPCAAVRHRIYYTPDEAEGLLPVRECEAEECRCEFFWLESDT